MRGFFERFGQVVRVGYDPELKQFVETVLGDVCPNDFSPAQVEKASAVISNFQPRKAQRALKEHKGSAKRRAS
jgi:hypothetical protein